MDLATRDLLELTSLPTAAGREGRVIDWIEGWARRHPGVAVGRDAFGNLLLQTERFGQQTPSRGDPPSRTIVFAAHLDHPAFVVTAPPDGTSGAAAVFAEFRGGVEDRYFPGAAVRWHGRDEQNAPGRVAVIGDSDGGIRQARLEFSESIEARPGDVITWDLPPAFIDGDVLHAPACDDLAPAAAALAVMAELSEADGELPDVRVLFTRAEEVGFVGAMAACHSGIIPDGALIVGLEASRSFADSPLGGGPIVRVGDRTSTFDPALTRAADRVAQQLSASDEGEAFKYQRKLMPGGTCEATAYQHLGHTATCVCLALGNYHNQGDDGLIASEMISLCDFRGLICLLISLARDLHTRGESDPLTESLNARFRKHRHLLLDT